MWVPIAYALLGTKVRIQDGIILFINRRLDQIRINPLLSYQTAIFWGGKSFFVFYRWWLPYYFGNSMSRVAIMFAVSDIISSYWLALMFQANHVVEGRPLQMPLLCFDEGHSFGRMVTFCVPAN